jgi:hypothetical protein
MLYYFDKRAGVSQPPTLYRFPPYLPCNYSRPLSLS